MTQPQPTPPENLPFPYQAAKAALWSPLIAIFLAVFTQPVIKDHPSSLYIIGITNTLLVLAGFILSLIALAAIPRLGPKNLLFRSLSAFLLTSAILATLIYTLFLFHPTYPIEQKLAGKWQSTDAPTVTQTLTLNPNKNYEITFTSHFGDTHLTGTWHVALNTDDHNLYLILKSNAPTSDTTLAFQIQQNTDSQLTLLQNNHPKTYTRLLP